MKYVPWKTANGWLLTDGGSIWESHIGNYFVFHSLDEFCKHVCGKKPAEKPKKKGGKQP